MTARDSEVRTDDSESIRNGADMIPLSVIPCRHICEVYDILDNDTMIFSVHD